MGSFVHLKLFLRLKKFTAKRREVILQEQQKQGKNTFCSMNSSQMGKSLEAVNHRISAKYYVFFSVFEVSEKKYCFFCTTHKNSSICTFWSPFY